MTKTIPERKVVTCDFCHKTDSEARFRTSTRLEWHGAALDYLGDPAASAHTMMDACDECASILRDRIHSVVKPALRKETK